MELIVDTASAALSVALIDGDALIDEHHEVVGRGHAETVVAVIAALVGDRGARVDGIVVDVGPGSFTGVRIGVAAARGLGLAWRVPVTGVGSLALVAAAAFADDDADTVVAVADAGRGRVYWQAFAHAGCTPLGAPAAGAAGDVVIPPGAVVAGTGGDAIDGRRLAAAYPRAADARRLGGSARTAPVPLYLGAAV